MRPTPALSRINPVSLVFYGQNVDNDRNLSLFLKIEDLRAHMCAVCNATIAKHTHWTLRCTTYRNIFLARKTSLTWTRGSTNSGPWNRSTAQTCCQAQYRRWKHLCCRRMLDVWCVHGGAACSGGEFVKLISIKTLCHNSWPYIYGGCSARNWVGYNAIYML